MLVYCYVFIISLYFSQDEKNDERGVSIQDLPDEILVEIFKYLNYYDLCRVGG